MLSEEQQALVGWCVGRLLAVAGISVLLPLSNRFVLGGWNGIGVFQTLGTCLVEMLAVNPCAPFVSPFLNHCGLLVSIGVNKCRYYLLLVSIICYSCRLVSLLFANRHAFSARQGSRVPGRTVRSRVVERASAPGAPGKLVCSMVGER